MTTYKDHASFNNCKLKCRACPVGNVYNQVILADGEGNKPKVLVIGECPGADELVHGKPFVGRSGKLLRTELNAAGYRKNNTLITNVIPCRPLNNEFPSDDAVIVSCIQKWLMNEIRLTKPEYILLVGGKPLKFVCGINGITRERGRLQQIEIDTHKIICIATFHPSYILRRQHKKNGKDIIADFKRDIRAMAQLAGFQQDS